MGGDGPLHELCVRASKGQGGTRLRHRYEVGRHSALSAIPNSQFMVWLIITHTLHHAHAMTLPRVEYRYHTRPRKIAKIKINYVSLSPWPIIALRLQSAPVFFCWGEELAKADLHTITPPSPGLAQVVY